MAIRSCHGKKNTQPTFCNQHRNSKGNVRTKVGFVFIIKFKKKTSSGILTKEGNISQSENRHQDTKL